MTLFIGRSDKPVCLFKKLANRHGLVTGATGTGKTVTLQVLAEEFSSAGVPVFAADAKGDLSGMAKQGEPKAALLERAKLVGCDFEPVAFPVILWDLFGEQGHPIRTTVAQMGPLLLSRMLRLTDAQEGAINVIFKTAEDDGLLLVDLDDLKALLRNLADRDDTATDYGLVTKATIGVIQRRLLILEEQGGDKFFGEPALELADLMRCAPDGRGYINLLAADKLMASPQLYATFLLWLLTTLFRELPEVGDPDKPKLVFFFDEAHLLFNDAPKHLVRIIEQVVRLIRSKGVGVYFVTQSPADVPEAILAQLGNKVQHALRAFTPKDLRGVKAAAQSFRPNPALGDTARAITELGMGVALVSVLEAKGTPTMVERTFIRPPMSYIGPLTPGERAATIERSPVANVYDERVNRLSAYEMLRSKLSAEPVTFGPVGAGGAGGAPRRGAMAQLALDIGGGCLIMLILFGLLAALL
jgi:DNA helicase HerA-like ATPase